MLNVQDDAAEAEWFSVSKPPQPLAFDHKLILRRAFQHLAEQKEAQTGNLRCNFQATIIGINPAQELVCFMLEDDAGNYESLWYCMS